MLQLLRLIKFFTFKIQLLRRDQNERPTWVCSKWGLTEEQWSAGHRSAAAMVRPFLKEISFKSIVFPINQVQWLGGRNSVIPPAASPERCLQAFPILRNPTAQQSKPGI